MGCRMSTDGLGPRDMNDPKPGWFVTPRMYGADEVRPRLLADRDWVTASIWEESQPDDSTILNAEIDGQMIDPHELWTTKLWPISEAEYHSRRSL